MDDADANGHGDHELAPLPAGIALLPRPDLGAPPIDTLAAAICHAEPADAALPCLGLEYRQYETGAGEADLRDLPPAHQRWLPGPAAEAIDALVVELVVGHPLRPDLLQALLRELLVNAVGHRSYAPPYVDRPVLVERFTDQYRVTSPGGLVSRVAAEDGTIRGRWSRNPRLMGYLGRQGYAHQQGRGLALVRAAARDVGCVWSMEARPDVVIARLQIDGALLVRAPDAVRQRFPADGRKARVLDAIRRRRAASVSELEAELDMPNSTLRAAIRALLVEGKITATEAAGRSPNQRYRVASRAS